MPDPSTLRFRQHPGHLLLQTALAAVFCVFTTVVAAGTDARLAARVAAGLGIVVGVGAIVAVWRQHLTVDARGISTRRVVWREAVEWSDVRTVTLTYVFDRHGSGWACAARLHDGRTAPRETFGDVLLRDGDRDRLITWIDRHMPDVPVAIDRTWPRQRPRRPATPAPRPDPAETIRSIREATVGTHRIVVTGVDGGFVALVRSEDGTEVDRGPIREVYREALDDGSRLVERYLDEV